MDRFDAMQAFARVAEVGSFTKAAEGLRLSRATVTQLIQQLEARLQAKLLHRTTRRVQLTPDGEHYYAQVLRLLADLETAESSLSNRQAALHGRLRVDVPSPWASRWLVPALPDFFARHPGIALDLGVSDRHVDLLAENVDCVVRAGAMPDQALVARRLATLEMELCAAPSYLERSGLPVHPRELQAPAHSLVGFRGVPGGKPLEVALQCGAEHFTLEAGARITLDDGQAYLAAGMAGLGAICVPRYLAAPHLAAGALVALLPGWQMAPMPLYVAYRPNRHLSARLRVFMDWLVDDLPRVHEASAASL